MDEAFDMLCEDVRMCFSLRGDISEQLEDEIFDILIDLAIRVSTKKNFFLKLFQTFMHLTSSGFVTLRISKFKKLLVCLSYTYVDSTFDEFEQELSSLREELLPEIRKASVYLVMDMHNNIESRNRTYHIRLMSILMDSHELLFFIFHPAARLLSLHGIKQFGHLLASLFLNSEAVKCLPITDHFKLFLAATTPILEEFKLARAHMLYHFMRVCYVNKRVREVNHTLVAEMVRNQDVIFERKDSAGFNLCFRLMMIYSNLGKYAIQIRPTGVVKEMSEEEELYRQCQKFYSCGQCSQECCSLKCSRCKQQFYCSSVCQKTHWFVHREVCTVHDKSG